MNTTHYPACQQSESIAYSVGDRNRSKKEPSFTYLKCDHCKVLRLDRVPSNLSDYYPSEYYKLPSLAQVQKMGRKDFYKIDLVRQYLQQGRLLEVGPALGIFAVQAKSSGFEVSAIELDHQCCSFLNNVAKIPTQQSSEPEIALLKAMPQHAIALWHVIEHLPNPWAVIEACSLKLESGGYLFIAAPNPDSFQHRVMRSHWPHTDAPRHLYLIPPQALIEFAQSQGMELVHYTTNDRYANQMNRFGWQRLLMNTVRFLPFKVAMYLAGYVLHLAMMGFDRREGQGSAYTIVLQKQGTTSGSGV
jgi:2-polyprenyl-3-methyl-5-hydroxy-6-metoxy-1,4-benzoquinol methylase